MRKKLLAKSTPVEPIERRILLMQGQRVMLDAEVVTNCGHLHRLKFSPTLPYAFTEHGAVMLANHDEKIHSIFDAIRQLMSPPHSPRRRIGFLEASIQENPAISSKLLSRNIPRVSGKREFHAG